MKVHPIIFQPEMVRALLAGRKTQTRRLRWGKEQETPRKKSEIGEGYFVTGSGYKYQTPLARVKAGDVLYVRESHWRWGYWDYQPSEKITFVPQAHEPMHFGDEAPGYVAPKRIIGKTAWWLRPSIFLPREGSRLTLAVTEVRFEPLQNISEADAKAEGARSVDYATGRECILDPDMGSYRLHYAEIWRQINGAASWDENPEVVALTFKVHRQNVDEFLRAGAANG